MIKYFFDPLGNKNDRNQIKTKINKVPHRTIKFDLFYLRDYLGNAKNKGNAHKSKQATPDELKFRFVMSHYLII
jgi:hypothetical protein